MKTIVTGPEKTICHLHFTRPKVQMRC